MSGTSTGRNELIYELRETSLLGNAIQKCVMVDKAVQIEPNMDLGSGDSADYSIDISNHHETYTEEQKYPLGNHETTASIVNETHSFERSSPITSVRFEHNSSENLHKTKSNDNLFKAKSGERLNKSIENINHIDEGNKNLTLAIVEDNNQQQPSFTTNESNPTVPSPTEHSKTSTLRISDRTRSESEDDIEKMDESEPDGGFIGNKTGLKTSTTTNEKLPNSEKKEKNANWSENRQNEADDDCAAQCLYYTLQCCECIIL